MRIDFVGSLVYFVCSPLCSIHECCTSAFSLFSQLHQYSVHFSFQQPTVRELVYLLLTHDLDND